MAKAPVRRAAKTTKAGTSATTTKTARSTRARSTGAATGARRRTEPPAVGGKAKAKAAVPRGSGKKPAPTLAYDLSAAGGRVVSVFGAFNSRVLVEIPMAQAAKLFDGPLSRSSPTRLVESVEHDMAELRKRAPQIADSALAASALAMAMEVENPFNSATSKSMCAKALLDALDRLRELTPVEAESDELDDLARRRAARIAGHPSS